MTDDARSVILARIRTALGSAPAVAEVPRDYHPAGAAAASLDRFVDRLLDYKATVVMSSAATLEADLATAVEGLSPLIVPPGLPFAVPGSTVDDGSLSPVELDAFAGVVTCCAAAVAETGTIALDGSPDQGRRAVSLVPDRHFCVVRADQVVAAVPDLLARLAPTRPLTLISGPSATSDIELNRVEGVHGPRTLVVLLVRD
ncbi:lactate utilization protein C [Dactylosporangium sp. NPDC051541]|uniref:lactate utilization protein C n=1 Tax=Dactylosporangium sp. NPDC051541 TaxID=3363977 RepID=UPI0037A2779B